MKQNGKTQKVAYMMYELVKLDIDPFGLEKVPGTNQESDITTSRI